MVVDLVEIPDLRYHVDVMGVAIKVHIEINDFTHKFFDHWVVIQILSFINLQLVLLSWLYHAGNHIWRKIAVEKVDLGYLLVEPRSVHVSIVVLFIKKQVNAVV